MVHPAAVTEKDQKKYTYIRMLTTLGRHSLACKKLGIHYSLPFHWAAVDPEFKVVVEEARNQAKAVLQYLHEEALDERAIDGVEKPITYQGKVINTYKEYDTTAGIFRLKGIDPATYRENHHVEVDNKGVEALLNRIQANRDRQVK
jgi:hypothetical protein